MFSKIAIIGFAAVSIEAMSTSDASSATTTVSPDTACAAYSKQTTCDAVNFCKWDDEDHCEANDDFVESINDAACVLHTTKSACETDSACEWYDTYCEGDDNSLAIITNSDGSITADMTGVNMPANGTFQDAGKYCAETYSEQATCDVDENCNWYSGKYGGDAGCQSDENAIQDKNQAVCDDLATIALCAADLRCEYNDDGGCEADNNIIVVENQ